jgi:hypothetical protein
LSYSWGVGSGPSRPGPLPEPAGITSAPVTVPARAPQAAPEPPADPPVSLELRRLAAELAPMVDVWQRLLLQHMPDTAGRCRTCTKGGTGLPATRWPCSIHGIAELARRCHDVA